MFTTPQPSPRRVLIAGGGVAGLETMLALRDIAGPRVDLQVLAPDETFHYQALDSAGPFGRAGVRDLELDELVRSGGARLRIGCLTGVDPERKVALTAKAEEIPYDALVVCTGARPVPAVEGAITFHGAAGQKAFAELLSTIRKEECTLAFALPPGASWALPLYELAFLTAGELAQRPTDLVIVTHESAPLAVFGPEVSEVVEVQLARNGIEIRTGVEITGYRDGALWFGSEGSLDADYVVAMPRLLGPALDGLPHDDEGFLPIDPFGRVEGVEDVYAAGDVTHHPIKQGGLASQQADAVASMIAAWAGAPVRPARYTAVLTGELLTIGASRYLEVDLDAPSRPAKIRFEPPSSSRGKIVSRYLSPFLASRGMGETSAQVRSAHE